MLEPFDPRALLQEHRDKLAALTPYPWAPVEAWIAGIRPLIRAHFAAHQADFDEVAKTPSWYQGIYMAGSSRWGGRTDNFARVDASARQHDSAEAERAKSKLLAFIEGVLSLSPPVTPQNAHASPITARLSELIEELENTPAHPWSGVSAWAAGARPFFKTKVSEFLEDFDNHVKHPPRANNPPEVDPISPYPVDPERQRQLRENAEYADARENEANAQTAFKALRLFLRGVRDTLLLPPVEPWAQPRSGDTYNFNGPVNQAAFGGSTASTSSTATISESNVGAAAIGAASTATGHVKKSST